MEKLSPDTLRTRPWHAFETEGSRLSGLGRWKAAEILVPLVVIAGADDISVQEYVDLGYQIMIYATTPAIVAANARSV
jgi:hypothetical protein